MRRALRCSDAPAVVARLQEAARGLDPEAPTVWGPDHWRDAVAIFPRADALPAMLALATEAGHRLGVQ
eukprot:11184119-Lingulodinium_polyedra.AAC.1